MNPPLHAREAERLAAVYRLGILDTEPDPRFDALTKEATERLNVPISTISILGDNREWYKSCQGIDAKEGPRETAFCGWALLAKNAMVVEDTLLDKRFKNNPYVTGEPHIRFYVGVAIVDLVSGLPIGVFCVKGTKPRTFDINELKIIFELAKKAEALINKKEPVK